MSTPLPTNFLGASASKFEGLSDTSSVLRVLVVERDSNLRQLLGETLRAAGHFVALTATAEDGGALFRAKPWHIVITHSIHTTPGGEAMIAVVKTISPHTPVLMITSARSTAPHPQIDAVLSKPFRTAELAAAIAECLRKGLGATTPRFRDYFFAVQSIGHAEARSFQLRISIDGPVMGFIPVHTSAFALRFPLKATHASEQDAHAERDALIHWLKNDFSRSPLMPDTDPDGLFTAEIIS